MWCGEQMLQAAMTVALCLLSVCGRDSWCILAAMTAQQVCSLRIWSVWLWPSYAIDQLSTTHTPHQHFTKHEIWETRHFTKYNICENTTTFHKTQRKHDISDYRLPKKVGQFIVCDWTEPKSLATVQCRLLFLLCSLLLSAVLAHILIEFERMKRRLKS